MRQQADTGNTDNTANNPHTMVNSWLELMSNKSCTNLIEFPSKQSKWIKWWHAQISQSRV